MAPYISVLIPLYNGIEYLNEAIDSVISQTYSDWELLIGVNGYGSDGGDVLKIAEEIVVLKNDPRIYVTNYPDVKGGAEAKNALVADAKANIIAILDVDDKWHPSKLYNQYNIFNTIKPQPDVIGTQCEYFGEMSGSPKLEFGIIDNNIFKEYNPIICSSVLMKKNLVDFTDLFYGMDDYDVWIRLSLQNKVFYNIPDKLTYHRVHKKSHYNASNKQDPEALRNYYFRAGKN